MCRPGFSSPALLTRSLPADSQDAFHSWGEHPRDQVLTFLRR